MSSLRLRAAHLGLVLVPLSLFAAGDADPLEPSEKAATEWIKVRLEQSRLEGDWRADKPLLEATVNALTQRAGSLEEKRDELVAKTAKDREETEGLQAKGKVASEDLASSSDRLKELSSSLVALRPNLPSRLSEALELPYKSLANPSISAGDRMQLSMTILNRCAAFNHAVTCGEDVISVDGGADKRSLEVIYFGLGRAYALDRAAGKAWLGHPGQSGWTWDPAPEAAGSVARLIAVYNDKADPEFVNVPSVLAQAGTGEGGK